MESVATAVSGQVDRVLASRRMRPRRLLAMADVFAAVVSFGVLGGLLSWRQVEGDPAVAVTCLIAGLVLLLTLVLALREGQYSAGRRLSRLSDAGSLARALIIAVAAVAVVTYVTHGFFTDFISPSRLVLALALAVFFALGLLGRWLLSAYQRALFVSGESVRNVLLIGEGETAQGFLRFLDSRPWLGVKCVGRLGCPAVGSAERSEDTAASFPGTSDIDFALSLEGLDALHRALVGRRASEVVVALDPKESSLLPEIARMLCIAHVPFRVVPSLFECTFRPAGLLGYAELPVIEMDVDPLDRVQRLFKRVLDVAGAGAVLAIGACPALLLMAAIKLDSRGPVFYRQERVGRNGRRFQMLKFRSMVQDADKLLAKLKDADESGSSGQMFKMRRDPRVTRVGAFLRRWSLDETPQFINVLRGEMSLVGPRPPLPREVDSYEQQHLCRLRAMPGITGLWQVSGRSNLTFEQMVQLDRHYMENWSIGADLSILLKTVYVVLARKGAF